MTDDATAARPRRPAHPHRRLRRHRRRRRDPRPRRRARRARRHRHHRPRADRRRASPPGRWPSTEGSRVEVVVGEEVTTLGGHLLALFIERPIRPYRSLRATIADVHDAGGLAIPAHPLVPYPLCAQGWVLRRLLDDPDAAVRPGRARDVQPDGARPAVARSCRALRRRARPGPRRATATPTRSPRSATGWTTFPGRTRRRPARGHRGRRRPSTAGRSTARPGRSACSGSSCASARATLATRCAAASARRHRTRPRLSRRPRAAAPLRSDGGTDQERP